METKAERIAKLLDIVSNKSGRIKKLKLECGQRAIKICVLNERVKELEQAVDEALALVRAEWKVRGNHPASNWAKEVEYFEHVLKGK